MMLTTRFTEAAEYARAHHDADLRKGTTIPYLSHLLAVSALVIENGENEPQAIAALLHDVVAGDGGGEAARAEIADCFSSDVAAIVAGCSDTTAAVKEDWQVRKDRDLEHLELAPKSAASVCATTSPVTSTAWRPSARRTSAPRASSTTTPLRSPGSSATITATCARPARTSHASRPRSPSRWPR